MTGVADRPRHGGVRSAAARRLDVAGVALVGASVAWTGITARSSLADAVPVAALQAGCAATYAAARWAGRRQRPAGPVAALAAGGGLLALGVVIPGRGTLGYENADAALYVQMAIAAAMAGAAVGPRWVKAAAGPAAGAFVLAALLSGSVTAVVAVCLVGALSAAVAARMARLAVGGGAVAVLLVVGATAFVGVARVTGAAPGIVSRVADAADERRVALWADAADIARDHPLAGAGPSRFQELSPTARSDPDARWAHSDFLQQGAEGGGVALALLLAAFGWGLARVWVAGADDPFTALGAMALVSLGLHAGVDYVLHFPLLALVAAALLGAATAPRPAPATGIPGLRRPGR